MDARRRVDRIEARALEDMTDAQLEEIAGELTPEEDRILRSMTFEELDALARSRDAEAVWARMVRKYR